LFSGAGFFPVVKPVNKPFIRRGLKVALAMIVATSLVGVVAVHGFKADAEKHVASMLQQTLNATHESLERWENQQRRDVHLWSQSDELVSIVQSLLKLSPTRQVLKNSPNQKKLRKLLRFAVKQHDYAGFFIISPDFISIASMRDSSLGRVSVLHQQKHLLERVFAGDTRISLPLASEIALPDAQGRLVKGLPTIFVVSPVRNAADKVIAALAFRIRSEDSYAHIVAFGRGGHSMESYMFDAQGHLLTPSRFEKDLRRAGLISGKQTSALHVVLRDPGWNLTETATLPDHYAQRPLTRMVTMAVRGQSGMNLKGYNDYRGVPVVGAWLWDEREDYGLAVKIDSADAYLLLNSVRKIFFGVLLVLMAMFIMMVFFIERLNRQVAENIEVSEARYRLLFDVIPDAVVVHREGKIAYCNAAAVRMFGAADSREINGKPIMNLVHPDDRADVEERIRNALQSGDVLPLNEEHLLRLNGEIFIAEVEGCRFTDAEGDAVLVVARDISLRRQAEKERERLRVVVEQSPEGIMITNTAGKIVYANPAMAKATGCSQDDLLGMYAADTRNGSKHDALYEEIVSTLNVGDSWQGEVLLQQPDGSQCLVKRRVSPVIENGKTIYHVSIDQDVTDERRIQKKMEHAQRLESMGVLAGGIAHDFNNILATIMGNASLAKIKFPEQQELGKYLFRIEEASKRAAALCEQMLAYSGKGHFIVKPVNLSKMVRELPDLLEASISKKIELRLELADVIPTVHVDVTQIQQVMMNLLINASDAIGDETGVVTLRTGVTQATAHELEKSCTGDDLIPGDYVFLDVQDSGCGMCEQTLKKLFDPFYTTKFTGRGLGMSAVLGIIRGHHGAITVQSKEGEGSTFRVLLPPSKEKAKEVVDADDVHIAWCPTGTVLVVDDEITVREAAVTMLETVGFKTIEACDGEEAVQIYRLHQDEISLVLLDVTMPRLDGVGCFRLLREMNPDVRVVLSSGYNEKEATRGFAEDDLAGFVQKPYRVETLISHLRQVLEGQVSVRESSA